MQPSNRDLYNRLIEWVSDYCTENEIDFFTTLRALRTFGPGITEENFQDRFHSCIDYIHGNVSPQESI